MPKFKLINEDCLGPFGLGSLEDNSVDSVTTDPPYELGFMGKSWDSTGIAYDTRVWTECLRVLKPGGHLLAFGGSRTYHRLACAVEDAGFEIRDQIFWVYGSGFPKSLDVSKAIDKSLGRDNDRTFKCKNPADRPYTYAEGETSTGWQSPIRPDKTNPASEEAQQWDGWGTALKPAHEPIVLARKPLVGTVAANVLQHGTGALNIDACRVPGEPVPINKLESWSGFGQEKCPDYEATVNTQGRWPANLIHDGSKEVLDEFAKYGESKSGIAVQRNGGGQKIGGNGIYAGSNGLTRDDAGYGDAGTPARFFYCAKANKKDRGDNNHPTVKPTELMRYLCRLITPPGGTVLDPFMGSGSTGKAALLEGFNFVGIEKDPGYYAIAERRVAAADSSVPDLRNDAGGLALQTVVPELLSVP